MTIKLHPYLNFSGNTEEAFELYKSVFGGDFTTLVRFKDMPMEGMEVPEKDKNKVMHVSLPVGDTVLMASDTLEAFGQELRPGNNYHISIDPPSKEEADRIFDALAQGGEIGMPLAMQVWGDYYGDVTDKFGVHWMVNYTEKPA